MLLFPSVAVSEGRGVISHDIGIQFVEGGVRAVLSKRGGIFGDLYGFSVVLIKFGLCRQSVIQEHFLKDANGITGATPELLFLASAIVCRIGHRVSTEAIGFDLQQRWTLAGMRPFDGAARSFID